MTASLDPLDIFSSNPKIIDIGDDKIQPTKSNFQPINLLTEKKKYIFYMDENGIKNN